MKQKCAACGKAKGKRICRRHGGQAICPPCCASIRNSVCEGCGHYEASERYAAGKTRNSPPRERDKHFIAVFDQRVDDEIEKIADMIESGQLEESEKKLSKLLLEHPMNQNVHFCAGVLEVKRDDFRKALKHFDKAIEIFPYFVEAYSNKLGCHREFGDVKNAIRAAQKVVLYGDPEEDYVKEAEKLLDLLARSIKKTSGLSIGEYLANSDRFDEAVALMDSREYARALPIFEECHARCPAHVQTMNNIGTCLMFLGRRDEGVRYFEKAIDADPGYAPAKLNLEAARSGKDVKELEFVTVESGKSEFIEGKADQAVELAEDGKFAEAEKTIAPLLKAHPDNCEVLSAAAVVRMAQSKYAEALEFLDKAISICPDDGLAYFNKGLCHEELNQFKDAVMSYRKGIGLLPESEKECRQNAQRNLAVLEKQIRDHTGGSLDDYVEHQDDFYEADRQLKKKNSAKALEIYERLQEKFPRHKQMLNSMAVCHLELGRPDQAEALLRKALEIDPAYQSAKNNLKILKHFGGRVKDLPIVHRFKDGLPEAKKSLLARLWENFPLRKD